MQQQLRQGKADNGVAALAATGVTVGTVAVGRNMLRNQNLIQNISDNVAQSNALTSTAQSLNGLTGLITGNEAQTFSTESAKTIAKGVKASVKGYGKVGEATIKTFADQGSAQASVANVAKDTASSLGDKVSKLSELSKGDKRLLAVTGAVVGGLAFMKAREMTRPDPKIETAEFELEGRIRSARAQGAGYAR